MSVLKVKKDSVWEEVGGISDHTHTTTDITNFPSSLPADGGNADTVDGKHASDFAAATDMTTAQSDISDLQSKVGDATVSAQISAAIEEKVSVAGEAEALESLSECGIITPAYQDGVLYTDASGAIYVL